MSHQGENTLKKKNPESRVCLQMDSQGRVSFCHIHFYFFRVMIMRMHCYLCLKWIRKAGDQQSIPQASALVPKEDTNNYMWLLCHCIKSGIDFDKAVIFSDRGHHV
jgi:hypothetical protein